jgi:tetratricopeptide (TPR) repeat protein
MMTGHLKEARVLMEQAVELLPEEPMIVSLQGVYYALVGKEEKAMECLNKACTIPKTFGHAHHSYYQIACILSLLERPEAGFEWLERSVASGFACWPYFLKDPWIKHLRELPAFDVLVSSLQAKYPDHLGLL